MMDTEATALANRIASEIERYVVHNDRKEPLDLPDKVFTELYRAFAALPDAKAGFGLLESCRAIRDWLKDVYWCGASAEKLADMRSQWEEIRPRLDGYAAFVDERRKDRGRRTQDREQTATPSSRTPKEDGRAFGIASLKFVERGRVITVDGQPFGGVDSKMFAVVKALADAEPDAVKKQTLVNKKLITEDATSTDLNTRLPEGFPIRIRGGRHGLQLVYVGVGSR
jgi:hypothetical protein